MDWSKTLLNYGVVILYYKRGPGIVDTINDLLASDCAPARVVLVDNGSGDAYFRELADSYADQDNIGFASLPTNLGYSGGMNYGASVLGSEVDFYLFVTHEVRLDIETVGKLIHALDGDSEIALAAPLLVRQASGEVWSAGGAFDRFGGVVHGTDPQGGVRRVAWVDGACLALRRTDFWKLSGFDNRYFLYWEDVDISDRAREIGDVVIVLDARASQETGTAPVYFMSRNRIVFWKVRGKYGKLALSVGFFLLKAALRDLPSGRWAVLRARTVGMIHGLTGKLDLKYRSVLETAK